MSDYWVDRHGDIHYVTGMNALYAFSERAQLSDGTKLDAIKAVNRMGEYHYNEGGLHRLDGPAVIFNSGNIEYWVDGSIPLTFDDILIISDEIDLDTFPSAQMVPNIVYDGSYMAYRLDLDEFTLAVLRYS